MRLNQFVQDIPVESLAQFCGMLRGAVFGDLVVELSAGGGGDDHRSGAAATVDLSWLHSDGGASGDDDVAQHDDSLGPLRDSLPYQLAALGSVREPLGDAPLRQTYGDVMGSLNAWIREHAQLPILPIVNADSFHCLFQIGSGSLRATLLIECDEHWLGFTVTATAALQRFTSALSQDLRMRRADPVRCLARCIALAYSALVTEDIRNPPNELLPSDLPVPLFVTRSMTEAVKHMVSQGRPTFEIAERVRLIRHMLQQGREEDAQRSIVADMFGYEVPPDLCDLLRVNHSGDQRFGRGNPGLFGPRPTAPAQPTSTYLPTGTRAGRLALSREIEFIQQNHKRFDELGIEVRLTGVGRSALASGGAPSMSQGSDLYRWTVWLYGFDSVETQRRQFRYRGREAPAVRDDASWFDVSDPAFDLAPTDLWSDDENSEGYGDDDDNDDDDDDEDAPVSGKKGKRKVAPPLKWREMTKEFAESSSRFGAELAAYNKEMASRCQFAILKRTHFRRPQVQLELRFDDTQAMPTAPMIRVISPVLEPLKSSDGGGITESGSLLSASQEGELFEMGADGKLRRASAVAPGDSEGKQSRQLSASVAFETSGGWETDARMRDVLLRLWCWLAEAGARIDMPASLDPAGGLPTEGGFWNVLRCVTPSAVDGGASLEESGKVILPASCLELLMDPSGDNGTVALSAMANFGAEQAAMQVRASAPMLFEISSADGGQRRTFAGVAEFTAPEGYVVIPLWLMANAQLTPNSRCSVRRVQLPRGTHLRLRPHDASFLADGDAKAQLEWRLPRYPALTRGDVLQLGNGTKLDVLDVKPGRSVLVIDTDIEVDFAPHLGAETKPTPGGSGARPQDAVSTSVFGTATAVAAPAPATATVSAKPGAALGGADDGVLCPNCRRRVPPSALTMHQLRCERSNYYCEECNDVIAIADRQKHIAAMHLPIECSQCKAKVMRRELQAHLADKCARRMVRCDYHEFCGIRVPADELSAHQRECGEKTELCETCHQRIARKRYESHLPLCLSESIPSPPKSTLWSNPSAGDDIMVGGAGIGRTHARVPSPVSSADWPPGARGGGGGSGGGGEMFTCPYCHISEPFFDELQVHILTTHPEAS